MYKTFHGLKYNFKTALTLDSAELKQNVDSSQCRDWNGPGQCRLIGMWLLTCTGQ